MTSRTELQSAYVLHTRPFRETSLLLDCITHDHGKVSLIAKGAKRPKSPFKGILQPFIPLLISYLGRSDLKTLTHAELDGRLFSISRQHFPSAFYLNELLMRLLHPHVAFPELFTHYHQMMKIFISDNHCNARLRLFEKHILQALGYELTLHRDLNGEDILSDNHYLYTPEHGLLRVREETHASRCVVKGKTLLDLASDDLSDANSCAQAKLILQEALKRLLGDKPIQAKFLLL